MRVNQTFVRLGRNGQGMFYEPADLTEKSVLAVIMMHSDGDYLTFPLGLAMAERGYRVLCANVQDRDNSLNLKLLDVKRAVEKVRENGDVKKIVLMGHSGGATLMSAYQNLAENGVKIFQGPEKVIPCSDDLAGLPPTDGIMLLDPNYGLSVMTLFSLDPAIVDEDNAMKINEELNLFNPSNGFQREGSVYSDEFIKKFQKAQGERNNRIVDAALKRLELIKSGKGRYMDDEPFIIPAGTLLGFNNKLFAQDTRLLSHTKKAWPLLKGDGSVTNEIVHTVRKPENMESVTPLYRGVRVTTVRTFLDTYAIRTLDNYGFNEDSMYGIDWSSCFSTPPGNIREIHVPTLTMGMTGSWEYLAAEIVCENSPAEDKAAVFVEGANHIFRTAEKCERFPGEFGDTQKTTFDYVDTWLSQTGRFL